MKTIQVTTANMTRNLFPVTGAMLSTGRRIVGLFETPEDARSIDADELAWGSTSYDKLTPEEQVIADANAEELE